MRNHVTLLTVLASFSSLILSDSSAAQTADAINQLASTALQSKSYREKDGKTILYGVTTNGPDTKNGQWACAKVVTIILKEAKVVDSISVGVRHVENALNGCLLYTSPSPRD